MATLHSHQKNRFYCLYAVVNSFVVLFTIRNYYYTYLHPLTDTYVLSRYQFIGLSSRFNPQGSHLLKDNCNIQLLACPISDNNRKCSNSRQLIMDNDYTLTNATHMKKFLKNEINGNRAVNYMPPTAGIHIRRMNSI